MWIVEKDAIKQIKTSEITDSEVGLKALGLCRMPAMWTLPFFVISSDFYNDINKAVDKRKEAEKYRENINTVINKMGMSGKKIIRSSGTKEGMEERGKYDSEIASEMDDIISKLIELVNKLSEYNELDSNGMPFIIQSFLEADIIGHISNERRFSEEKRDFVFEYKQYLLGNKKDERFSQVETGKVPLRNWREKIDIEQYTNTKLRYDSNKLREVLKIVCTFFLQKKERVHLEFVCDDSTFYLVQCDYQKKAKHITNPEEYDIVVYKERKEFYPKVLRRIQDEDKGKYKKIDNVFVYKELGIELPSLYLLDDPSTLSKLEEGIVSKDLQDDLEHMCKYSVVIRTDLKWEKSEESQLLKRSNEIKVYSEAEDFLLKTSKKLRETGKNNYGFILHNFIPARIAAFVNAKPLEESVEIQALWGLPEGLYYNSYDRIIIHTKTINIAKMDQEKFKIIREEKYKEKFIAPDENGKWVVKKLGEPYDWRCTIKDDQILKDIAYNARRIAEKVNEELSIMWFVDIDEQFYHANNIPWYHEKLARQGYYHPDKESRYKKKYFYEKEMVVKTRGDLNKIENTRSSDVGIVRIQPKDDSLLRSRSFICELGRVCKEKGVSIFLEGSVLTHTFYQLKSTGATVLT